MSYINVKKKRNFNISHKHFSFMRNAEKLN